MAEDVKTAQTNEEVVTNAADEKSTKQTEDTAQPSESASQSTPEAKEQKPQQSEEQNAAYARARREKEQKAAIDKASADAVKAERVKNIVEFVKTNPYTQKPIKSAEDVDQYLLMKRISDDGGEPLQDYADYIDRKNAESTAAKQKEAETEARMHSDISDFKKAHPEIKLEDVLQDDIFVQMFGNSIGTVPLNTLYGKYNSFLDGVREKEKNRLAEEVAKKQSGTGSASNPTVTPEITLKEFRRMGLDARQKLCEENPELYRQLTK